MLEGWGERLSGASVPETGGAVVGPRQDGPAVGTEGHGDDAGLMPKGRGERLSGVRVPKASGAVVGPRQDSPAVRAESHGVYSRRMPKREPEPFVVRAHQVSCPPSEPFAVLQTQSLKVAQKALIPLAGL